MDTLHSELSKVNQTWWQTDDKGSFYELPRDLAARDELQGLSAVDLYESYVSRYTVKLYRTVSKF